MSVYDDDLSNAKTLVDWLGIGHPKYQDAWILYQRLVENTERASIHGDTPELRAERSQIRAALNKISVEVFKTPLDQIGASHKKVVHPEQNSNSGTEQKESGKLAVSLELNILKELIQIAIHIEFKLANGKAMDIDQAYVKNIIQLSGKLRKETNNRALAVHLVDIVHAAYAVSDNERSSKYFETLQILSGKLQNLREFE